MVGEDHLQGVWRMLSLNQERVRQVELFEVDQKIQVDHPDLGVQIQGDLLLQNTVDHQVQDEVDHQVQDEVGHQVQDEEDLQVLNVVVHQVHWVDSFQELLEEGNHLEDHLGGSCSVVLEGNHCLVGSYSEMVGTGHWEVHYIHRVHCHHSSHCNLLAQREDHHNPCQDHYILVHHQNTEDHNQVLVLHHHHNCIQDHNQRGDLQGGH